MSRLRNTSRNIVWGTFERCISLGMPFLIRTIMIYTLGELYLGLNGLFTSILQVLNVTELGISSAIVFSMYKPLAEGDDVQVCALINLYRKLYRIIGLVILVLGLALLPFLRSLISGETPEDVSIYILYLMNLASTVLSYQLFSYRSSLLSANQRQDLISKVNMCVMLVKSMLQITALLVFRNFYFFILCNVVGNIANNILSAWLSKKTYPQFYCKGTVDKETLVGIKRKVSGMFLQKIGGVVLSSVDTIVISSFLGLRMLAIYQNYFYIISTLFGFLIIIMNSMIAPIGNSVATESVEKNYKDFKTFNYIYIWIVCWCTGCLLCLYQPFMKLWVGEELMLSDNLVILFAIYFFTHKWCDMLYVYQQACGIWWETRLVPLIAAILNLIVNIVLVQIFGLAGILISTIISMVFVYNTGYAVVLFKTYFKSKQMLRNFIVRQFIYLATMVFGVCLASYICSLIQFNTIPQLFVNAIICTVIPNALYFAVWRRFPEFKNALNLVESILKKQTRGMQYKQRSIQKES